MTSEVIDFAKAKEDRTPHMTGNARCQCCHHEWIAVAPVGTHKLECPMCSSTKAYMLNSVLRGEQWWECNCGCDVFRISPTLGPYCINCATPATGWFE